MANASSLRFVLVFLIAVTTTPFCKAFSVVVGPSSSSTSRSVTLPTLPSSPWCQQPQQTRLYQAEASEEGSEATADGVQEDASDEEQEEEKPPQEDPEVTELKEKIAELEATLKSKTGELRYISDSADDYTKSGYARQVAQMENMKRIRSSMAASNKHTAEASVLREFLSVKDQLTGLQERFGEDDFGKQYNALKSALDTVFSDLGVAEYTTAPGDAVDRMRMLVVESENSEEFPKDTVLKPLKMGLELQGNVIRLAECVASLGSETAEEEAAAAAPQDESTGE